MLWLHSTSPIADESYGLWTEYFTLRGYIEPNFRQRWTSWSQTLTSCDLKLLLVNIFATVWLANSTDVILNDIITSANNHSLFNETAWGNLQATSWALYDSALSFAIMLQRLWVKFRLIGFGCVANSRSVTCAFSPISRDGIFPTRESSHRNLTRSVWYSRMRVIP